MPTWISPLLQTRVSQAKAVSRMQSRDKSPTAGEAPTPSSKPPPSVVSPQHHPHPMQVSPQQPFAIEICCGQASLSRELINAGFSVLAVDHVMHDPQVPVTLLDLTQDDHQNILIDLLNNRPPDYIHLGMPCGTASRARERPVARDKIKQGAPQPPPLRSADHPLGLPHINPDSTSGIRLKKANQLYRFVIDILLIAMKSHSVISLGNPVSILVLGSHFGICSGSKQR